MEALLEKYTDLYDFAPVGYFSLDEQGRILEANLMGAALLGVERSLLINRRLPRFVVPASQPIFLAFLETSLRRDRETGV
jgi:PAS domain S-box-containing protein